MSDTHTRTHYHVQQFTPGCLSDCDDGPYFSRRDARDTARLIAQSYKEEGNKVKGNSVTGYTINGNYRIVVESCNERCTDYH